MMTSVPSLRCLTCRSHLASLSSGNSWPGDSRGALSQNGPGPQHLSTKDLFLDLYKFPRSCKTKQI